MGHSAAVLSKLLSHFAHELGLLDELRVESVAEIGLHASARLGDE